MLKLKKLERYFIWALVLLATHELLQQQRSCTAVIVKVRPLEVATSAGAGVRWAVEDKSDARAVTTIMRVGRRKCQST